MFYVIYEIDVPSGNEKAFVELWSQMTIAIRDHMGGLGSRLHSSSPGVFIAYAQWPDRQTWKSAGEKQFPQHLRETQRAFQQTRSKVTVKYELEAIKDLLNPLP